MEKGLKQIEIPSGVTGMFSLNRWASQNVELEQQHKNDASEVLQSYTPVELQVDYESGPPSPPPQGTP